MFKVDTDRPPRGRKGLWIHDVLTGRDVKVGTKGGKG